MRAAGKAGLSVPSQIAQSDRMGLDTVELVMRFEEGFGITIPDAVAERMMTPRDVADYVETELKRAAPGRAVAAAEVRPDMTRAEIAGIIREITLDQLGIDPADYGEDKTFVEDFGAD